MPIITSTHALGPVQADGRRFVTETHTDHLGAAHLVEYLASADADYVAVLTARAAQITEQLAEAEADALLG